MAHAGTSSGRLAWRPVGWVYRVRYRTPLRAPPHFDGATSSRGSGSSGGGRLAARREGGAPGQVARNSDDDSERDAGEATWATLGDDASTRAPPAYDRASDDPAAAAPMASLVAGQGDSGAPAALPPPLGPKPADVGVLTIRLVGRPKPGPIHR
jgi:hypothetical protein